MRFVVALVVTSVLALPAIPSTSSGDVRLLRPVALSGVVGGNVSYFPGQCVPGDPGSMCNQPYHDCDGGDPYCNEGNGTSPCTYEREYLNPTRCQSDPAVPPSEFSCEEDPEEGMILCSRDRLCICFEHPELGWLCGDKDDPVTNPWMPHEEAKCKLDIPYFGS